MNRIISFILLALSVSGASAAGYGDWQVEQSGPVIRAITHASDGISLTYACDARDRECVLFVDLGVRCEETARVPLLLNSDRAALAREGQCVITPDDRPVQAITADEALRDVLSNANWFAVASPLVETRVKVATFSLRGSATAISDVTARMERGSRPTVGQSFTPPHGTGAYDI